MLLMLCHELQICHPSIKPFLISLADVHPRSVCEKLGPKYASISVAELNKCGGFYEDLLRYISDGYA